MLGKPGDAPINCPSRGEAALNTDFSPSLLRKSGSRPLGQLLPPAPLFTGGSGWRSKRWGGCKYAEPKATPGKVKRKKKPWTVGATSKHIKYLWALARSFK